MTLTEEHVLGIPLSDFVVLVEPLESVGHDSERYRRIDAWVQEFVMRPHPELRRDGEVCPFVAPARLQKTLVMTSLRTGAAPTVAQLCATLRCCAELFRSYRWAGGNARLHAMLVVLGELTDEAALGLDAAHPTVKNELVQADIMMAQFHPRCSEPAARNPALPAFQSPVPMVAVRRLSFHDILFLHQKPEWFWHYERKYGRVYRRATGVDPHFAKLHDEALEKFGHG